MTPGAAHPFGETVVSEVAPCGQTPQRPGAGRAHAPGKEVPPVSEAAAAPADPGATIRSKSYRVLLVLAALLGVLVSFASWCFLELVHWIQTEVYQTPAQRAGIASRSLVVAAAGDGGGRGAGGRRDHPPARPRRAHPL